MFGASNSAAAVVASAAAFRDEAPTCAAITEHKRATGAEDGRGGEEECGF